IRRAARRREGPAEPPGARGRRGTTPPRTLGRAAARASLGSHARLAADRMDADRFVQQLPRLFARYPRSAHPRDRRFAAILEDVGGLARENNLALLNLAASLLGRGESYVEVGSFKGLSLIAAMLGNAGDFVGIDDFSLGGGGRRQLDANLRRYGLAGHTILEGDAF